MEENGYLKTVFLLTHIFADNQEAIKLTSNSKYHQKTKYIPIKYLKSQELVKDGSIIFYWIPTQDIVANGLTKLLDTKKFQKFIQMMRMIDT